MRERELVQTLAERLQRDGLSDLRVRYGSERGADIEGTLPRSCKRLFIEAKGIRARRNERAALGEALLQILRHYDYDVVCAIAVPYCEPFTELLRSILPGLSVLGIHILLVRPEEIWHVPPARHFSPERVESLVESLDQ